MRAASELLLRRVAPWTDREAAAAAVRAGRALVPRQQRQARRAQGPRERLIAELDIVVRRTAPDGCHGGTRQHGLALAALEAPASPAAAAARAAAVAAAVERTRTTEYHRETRAAQATATGTARCIDHEIAVQEGQAATEAEYRHGRRGSGIGRGRGRERRLVLYDRDP